MNYNGPLDFDATINTDQFNRMLDEMNRRMRGTSNAIEKEGSRIDATFKNIAAAATAYLSAQTFAGMVKEIASVRGEFQQLELAFETMLKNKQLSDKLMADVVDFAANTPFDLKGVAAGAKQLLAYGTEVKDIIPTMRRLGDVASGLSIPFGDLVYLYGTSATQGRIMTKDLMQFANRGIPIIDELGKILGVSKSRVLELASEGAIGFEHLQTVIQNLTNETGMFGGMMEKQSKTITGLVSNLGDAWDQMLNNIGKANEGAFESSIEAATVLVENYQQVLDILKVIIATYGAYRAAIILNTVALKGYNAALTIATIRQTALNIAQKASPWGLALTGITALVGGIWAYNRALSATPNLIDEVNKETSKEIVSLNSVFEALKKAKEGTEQRSGAINVINTRYKKYLENLLTEKSTLNEIERAQKRVTNGLIADIAVKQNKAQLEQTLGEVASSFDKSFEGFLKGYSDTFGADRIGEFITSINEAIDNEISARGGVIDRGVLEYSYFAKKVYDEYVREISQKTGFLKYSFEDFKESFLDFAETKAGKLPFIEQMKATIASFQSIVDSFNPEVQVITSDQSGSIVKTISQQLKEIQQLYENYYLWIEKYGKESADKQFEDLKAGGESFLEYLESEIKRIESKGIKTKQDRDDLSTYLATRADLLGSKTRLDMLQDELKAMQDQAKDTIDYLEKIKEKALTIGVGDNSETGYAMRKMLAEEIAATEKQAAKESADAYKEILKASADFSVKRKLLAEEYAELEKKLSKEALGPEAYEKALALLKENYAEKQKLLSLDEVKGTSAYKALADDLDRLTRIEANKYLKTLKDQLETLKEQPEVYKEIASFISQTENQLKSWSTQELAAGLQDAARGFESMLNVMFELDNEFSAIARQIAGIVGELGNALNSFKEGSFTNPVQAAFSFGTLIFKTVDLLDKQFGLQRKITDLEADRAEYNRQVSINLQSISSELDKQLKILDRLSIGAAFNPSVESLKNAIKSASEELEKLKFDLLNAPPNIKIQLDIEHLKKIFKTDDISEALSSAFAQGLISEEQYNLAVQYINTIEDAGERLKRLHDDYRDAILGTTSKSITDAIMQGLLAGKRGIEDFADSFEDLMKQALVNAMMVKRIQPQIDEFMDTWYNMAGDDDGLTSEEIKRLKIYYASILEGLGRDADELQRLFPDLFDAANATNSLSGAIKGVSEQTAGLIAGQMNAIRMNQAHALSLMDESLVHMQEIAANTRFNRHLALLADIKQILQSSSSNSSNSNRAAGGN